MTLARLRPAVIVLNLAAIFLWAARNPYALRALEARAAWDEARLADLEGDAMRAREAYRRAARLGEGPRRSSALYHAGCLAMDDLGETPGARADLGAYLETGARGARAADARARLADLEDGT